jgi:very-short-patch-repair endonuclease
MTLIHPRPFLLTELGEGRGKVQPEWIYLSSIEITASPSPRIRREAGGEGHMKSNSRQIRTPKAVRIRAKELRRNMTRAESLLWERLRNRRLCGLKFRRQHPLGRSIADFYCAEYRLVVELDGVIYDTQHGYDEERTRQFETFGYRVIRFRNDQIENEMEKVLSLISGTCTPLPELGEGQG